MKKKNNKLKIAALILVLCITLGYAALRTGLNINGTANVSSSSWNVYFSNYQMSNATNITPTTEPSISGTTTTSISYEVDLDVPGDLYEFSVEVVNGGSMDANISLTYKYNGSEIGPTNPVPEYITYIVTDANGDPIADNHRLNHGEREIVKVIVKYRDDDASVLPAQDVEGLSFDIEIEATKAERESTSTVYTLSLGENGEADTQIGQSIPNIVNVSATSDLAREHWIDVAGATRPFYLKHTLNGNNNITESYVEFVVTSEMAENNPGMVAGTYALRGAGGINCVYNQETYQYECETNSPYYDNNVDLIKEAFDYTNHPDRCYSSEDFLDCSVSNLEVRIDAQGGIYVSDQKYDTYVSICSISVYGNSQCSYCSGKAGC